ncbi:MAG: thiamine phosphate synthase [Thermoanaerobaculia bacterium]
MRPGAAPGPSSVYAIADAGALLPRRLAEGAEAMAQAGIRTIQLRAKSLDDGELFRESEECLRRLEGWEGELWIDDRVDLAAVLPFAGVQLGQRDLPPRAARKVLGPGSSRIGASTHDEAQWRRALTDPDVDWIAVGPVLPTTSKANPDPVVGFEELSRLSALGRVSGGVRKPLIAIGGIDASNVGRVLRSGADSAAVLSAVCVGDIDANCRRLLQAVDR